MAELSASEKRQLNKERQAAVRNAWKAEKENVSNGKASRDWTPAEKNELMNKGSISGYEGHHMKSVSKHPEHAGNPNNIQFLTHDEHLNGAHKGSYHNPTNGYYDYKTGKMHNFKGNELKPAHKQSLSQNKIQKNNSTNSQNFKNSLKSSSKKQGGNSSVSKSFSNSISTNSNSPNSSAGVSRSISVSNYKSSGTINR